MVTMFLLKGTSKAVCLLQAPVGTHPINPSRNPSGKKRLRQKFRCSGRIHGHKPSLGILKGSTKHW